MLIEFGMLAGISYVLHHKLFGKKSDKEKIEEVFKNIRFGFGDHLPRHVKTQASDGFKTYVYSLPYGLTDNDRLEEILSKTLYKPVELTMSNGKLLVKIYDGHLRRMYKYDWKETKAVPIGYSLGGTVYHDFDKIPHMTIAGMTRQGKTVLLKLLLAHTINNDPNAEFYILDLKGGLEFNRYKKQSAVKEIASDVSSANSLLRKILGNVDEDMAYFLRKGYNNIVNTKMKRRAYIIVDEGAELDKACQEQLSKIARIGGALGYRLIFATQYPTADTLPRQIKQNADARISFRLPTGVASRVAIDENGAEELPAPGRAIYRTHERQIIQVPYISDKDIEEKLRRYERNVATTEDEGDAGGTDIITFG